MIELLKQPWPWYVSGPLIGLMVPILFLVGNKAFGISSSLRHICAASVPLKISFFQYEWKQEAWNLFFVLGMCIGGFLAMHYLANPIEVHPSLKKELLQYGITDYSGLVPVQLFNWHSLWTVRSFTMMIGGGFLIGFGTRYAGGCTSGHSITGLSTLQYPSLIATICFMIGGFIMANLFLPFILSL